MVNEHGKEGEIMPSIYMSCVCVSGIVLVSATTEEEAAEAEGPQVELAPGLRQAYTLPTTQVKLCGH